MAKLTDRQLRLLRYPPTTETWACGRKRKNAEGETVICKGVMAGSKRACTTCRGEKRRTVKLLWPEYVAACDKAGIEPGTRWPVKAPANPERAKKARTKRKGQ